MARGKRYQTEGKLNYQKVFAVIIAIAVVIMFVFIIRNVLKEREEITKDYEYFALYSQNKWGSNKSRRRRSNPAIISGNDSNTR